MHYTTTILLLLFALLRLHAQPQNAKDVIDLVNQHLISIEKGAYSADYRKVDLFETDTVKNSGKVQFFKRNGVIGDSIARFSFIVPTENGQYFFDGINYITLNQNNKKIYYLPVGQKKGIEDYISHYNSARSNLLSVPILTNSPYKPISPTKWTKATMDYSELEGKQYIRLYQQSKYKIQMKLTPKDADSTIYTEEILIDPVNYDIKRLRSWADRGTGNPYFLEINYSPIVVLPDTLAFEDLYQPEVLIAQGYAFQENKILTKSETKMIAVGDSIPNFKLLYPTNDSLPLFGQSSYRYLLLDFWYLGCGPCIAAMPSINHIYQTYSSRGIGVVGISFKERDPEKARKFANKYGYTYPLLFGERSQEEQLKIYSYPTFAIIDCQTHKVVYVHSGYSETMGSEIMGVLDGLLK
jgi:peroxiredoxin